ncbi:MAG: 5,6-dimethylbenzimidazole synthase [Hyphomicrobiaceae bacterium]
MSSNRPDTCSADDVSLDKNGTDADAVPSFSPEFRQDLEALFTWRRDVRCFRKDPVPKDVLDNLLQLVSLSPSVGNSQPWRWVNVATDERRAFVADCFQQQNNLAAKDYEPETRDHYLQLKLAGLRQAPEQFAVFCDEVTEQGRELGRKTMPEMLAYSAVLSVHTFWLAARAHGIGVGWVSILDPKAVTEALDVPKDWRLVAYLCVGYPETEHIDPDLVRAKWQARTPLKIYDR